MPIPTAEILWFNSGAVVPAALISMSDTITLVLLVSLPMAKNSLIPGMSKPAAHGPRESILPNHTVSPKAAKEEAQGFVDELFAIGTRQWSEMEASFTKVIRDRIHNLDIASKKRLYALTSKVGKLEKPIETLEQQISTEKESSCI
jgi:hypothetical protein